MSRAPKPIKHLRATWSDVVLVCRKCSKKLGGGFGDGGDRRLAKTLKAVSKTGAAKGSKTRKGQRFGVVEVGCLDVCPRGAVMVVRAGAPGEWLVIPAGTPIETILDTIGLDRDPA